VQKQQKDSFFVLFADFCPFCFPKNLKFIIRSGHHKIRCGQENRKLKTENFFNEKL
jgi:hypothetical protein